MEKTGYIQLVLLAVLADDLADGDFLARAGVGGTGYRTDHFHAEVPLLALAIEEDWV